MSSFWEETKKFISGNIYSYILIGINIFISSHSLTTGMYNLRGSKDGNKEVVPVKNSEEIPEDHNEQMVSQKEYAAMAKAYRLVVSQNTRLIQERELTLAKQNKSLLRQLRQLKRDEVKRYKLI
jgi:hypothetical protein